MITTRTFDVEIWVTDCYLVSNIVAATKDDAERIALERYEQGGLTPFPDMQEVSSTHIEEVRL